MLKLAKSLKKNNIKFRWIIFTDLQLYNQKPFDMEEFIYMKPSHDILIILSKQIMAFSYPIQKVIVILSMNVFNMALLLFQRIILVFMSPLRTEKMAIC